ncbi:hypothetical protein B0H12DRAFT_285472 [Mycena haematopus]|nr:hypothetical protein B0H12DRAFT_285472 [Mycena haematopus]
MLARPRSSLLVSTHWHALANNISVQRFCPHGTIASFTFPAAQASITLFSSRSDGSDISSVPKASRDTVESFISISSSIPALDDSSTLPILYETFLRCCSRLPFPLGVVLVDFCATVDCRVSGRKHALPIARPPSLKWQAQRRTYAAEPAPARVSCAYKIQGDKPRSRGPALVTLRCRILCCVAPILYAASRPTHAARRPAFRYHNRRTGIDPLARGGSTSPGTIPLSSEPDDGGRARGMPSASRSRSWSRRAQRTRTATNELRRPRVGCADEGLFAQACSAVRICYGRMCESR